MASTYQYGKLPARKSIRLLKLLPGASDEQIQLELFITEQDSAPSYEAISYCWGDASDLQEIICCGQTMHITRSLYSDAICIDQSNNDEKGIQVNMMGDVYDQASRVLVWLGEASEEDARKAFNLIQRINDYFEARIVEREVVVNPATAVRNVRRLEDWQRLFQNNSQSLALRNLFRRPWFSRLWVLQEVSLATSAWLFYGAVSINFSEVVQSAFILSLLPDLQGKYPTGMLLDAFQAIFSTYAKENAWIQEKHVLRHSQNYLQEAFKTGLSEILLAGRGFQASNPLDHIYAFLGHPTAKVELGSSSILEADYTITIEEATHRLVERLYERDHRLDFLYHVLHSSLSGEHFPSWLPDFHTMPGVVLMDHESFNADNFGRTGNLAMANFQNNKLQVLNVMFDTIRLCTENFTEQKLLSSSLNPVELCWQLQAEVAPTAHMGEGLKALAWTLCGGIYIGDEVKLQRDFYSYCREKLSSQVIATMPLQESGTEPANSIPGNWMAFEASLQTIIRERRFFITTQGHFGLGPAKLQVRDTCCVLLGCRVPLVIRPTSTQGHFNLLGPSYIHNTIFGEMVEGVTSASDLTEITLV